MVIAFEVGSEPESVPHLRSAWLYDSAKQNNVTRFGVSCCSLLGAPHWYSFASTATNRLVSAAYSTNATIVQLTETQSKAFQLVWRLAKVQVANRRGRHLKSDYQCWL